ncbi:MAG: GGDEF domain-containing protein [Desulfuromonadales bacterium]|nr:GGDEF domain-containing protein [Desulfuromonadales bacterium]
MNFMKAFFLLIFPGGILFAVITYFRLTHAVPVSWQPVVALFPLLAAVAVLLLGWRFNRTRVLWVLLLLILSERALAAAPAFGREYLLAVLPVVIPLNFLLFICWMERGLVNLHGLARLLIVSAQVAVIAWLYYARAGEVIALLERPLLPALSHLALPFPQISLLILLLCFIGLLARYIQRSDAIEASFIWGLGAVTLGLARPEEFVFWGGVTLFLMALAVVEGSFSMAFNDELTGLPARRAMNESLLKVGRRYVIAMVDIDHFKKVNDTHGHDVGDQVLRMVATCLRRVSGGGRAYRYGGEEFAVIFPGKTAERALPHLEQLRESIAESGFVLRGKKRPKEKPQTQRKATSDKKLHVTASIGVSERSEDLATPEEVIKAADQALYRAKKGGRNQICSA